MGMRCQGSESGTPVTLGSGSYSVLESGVVGGYSIAYSSDCSVSQYSHRPWQRNGVPHTGFEADEASWDCDKGPDSWNYEIKG